MALEAIVILEQLRCLTLKNTESHTEPYIWPALIRIDDNTLHTTELVDVVTPRLSQARIVIQEDMDVGETAGIPSQVGVLRARFEDILSIRRLILVVALFENDETPKAAVEAGFLAFSRELGVAIQERFAEFGGATEEETAQLIKDLQKQVEDRVRSAIKDALTGWQKTRVFLGTLDLDDPLGSTSLPLSQPVDQQPDRLEPRSFTLSFETKGLIPVTPPFTPLESLSKYEIQGQMQLRRIVIEHCQPQVNAVNAAQEVVDAIEKEIKEVRAQLHGVHDPDEPLPPKAYLQAELERLCDEDLPFAEGVLTHARQELKFCRNVREGGVVTPRP